MACLCYTNIKFDASELKRANGQYKLKTTLEIDLDIDDYLKV